MKLSLEPHVILQGINIIDAPCGYGKSTWAINEVKTLIDNGDHRVMYTADILDELVRVIVEVNTRHGRTIDIPMIYTPIDYMTANAYKNGDGMLNTLRIQLNKRMGGTAYSKKVINELLKYTRKTKAESLMAIVSDCKNVVISSRLFRFMDMATMKIIRSSELYHLILDESPDVFKYSTSIGKGTLNTMMADTEYGVDIDYNGKIEFRNIEIYRENMETHKEAIQQDLFMLEEDEAIQPPIDTMEKLAEVYMESIRPILIVGSPDEFANFRLCVYDDAYKYECFISLTIMTFMSDCQPVMTYFRAVGDVTAYSMPPMSDHTTPSVNVVHCPEDLEYPEFKDMLRNRLLFINEDGKVSNLSGTNTGVIKDFKPIPHIKRVLPKGRWSEVDDDIYNWDRDRYRFSMSWYKRVGYPYTDEYNDKELSYASSPYERFPNMFYPPDHPDHDAGVSMIQTIRSINAATSALQNNYKAIAKYMGGTDKYIIYTAPKDYHRLIPNIRKKDTTCDVVKGKFIHHGIRATNKYTRYRCVFYAFNKFSNTPSSISVLRNGKVDKDNIINKTISSSNPLFYLVQFILRGCIRNGEDMLLYVPSPPMRKLLENWLK